MDRRPVIKQSFWSLRNLPAPVPQPHTYKTVYGYTYADTHLKAVLGNPWDVQQVAMATAVTAAEKNCLFTQFDL